MMRDDAISTDKLAEGGDSEEDQAQQAMDMDGFGLDDLLERGVGLLLLFEALDNGLDNEVAVLQRLERRRAAQVGGRRIARFRRDLPFRHAVVEKLSNPADHVVLPEVISKEPLGPMVRHGDDQWFDLVKWVLFAMVDAEELGITQKNVDEMAKSDKPELKRVFGTDGNLGEQLGLTKDWVIRIVKAVGNYGEAFDRNVGAGSKLGIARGLNQLWNKGGIQYAPPIR